MACHPLRPTQGEKWRMPWPQNANRLLHLRRLCTATQDPLWLIELSMRNTLQERLGFSPRPNAPSPQDRTNPGISRFLAGFLRRSSVAVVGRTPVLRRWPIALLPKRPTPLPRLPCVGAAASDVWVTHLQRSARFSADLLNSTLHCETTSPQLPCGSRTSSRRLSDDDGLKHIDSLMMDSNTSTVCSSPFISGSWFSKRTCLQVRVSRGETKTRGKCLQRTNLLERRKSASQNSRGMCSNKSKSSCSWNRPRWCCTHILVPPWANNQVGNCLKLIQ